MNLFDTSGCEYRIVRGRAVPLETASQRWERFEAHLSWFDRLFRWLFG